MCYSSGGMWLAGAASPRGTLLGKIGCAYLATPQAYILHLELPGLASGSWEEVEVWVGPWV